MDDLEPPTKIRRKSVSWDAEKSPEAESVTTEAFSAAAAAAMADSLAAPATAPPQTTPRLGADTPLPDAPAVLCGVDEAMAAAEAAGVANAPVPAAPGAPGPAADRADGRRPKRRSGGGSRAGAFDFSSWAVGRRYDVKRLLGRGSYGEVAEAWDRRRSRKVAIKRVVGVFEQFVDTKRIYREMYILRHLAPIPEVISLLDVVFHADFERFKDLYLVFEFVDTDLQKLIMSPQYLSTEHIRTFLYQILVGLKYIHSADVIHRDMKPANILLNEDCTLKICDFGLARVVVNEKAKLSTADAEATGDDAGTEDAPVAVATTKNGVPLIGDAADGSTEGEPTDDEAGTGAPAGAPADDGGDADPTSISARVRRQPKLKRQLTKHVVTRWYRAPELILLQDYTAAVDIWAVGCIFAELLSMQQASVPNFDDRVPLFPGKSCFPLSADVVPSSYGERVDQLHVIFDVIGTPSLEDMRTMSEVEQYLSSMERMEPRDLATVFPGADAPALDLLKSMLRFNPTKRCKVDDALEHPFLASLRNVELESTAAARVSIEMEYRAAAMTKEELKRCIWDELRIYRDRS